MVDLAHKVAMPKRHARVSVGLEIADRHAPAATGPHHLTRRAQTPIAASTYDASARTVEAVLSTGSAVARWGYIEVLEVTPSAIDLSRVESGLCSLLDTHNSYELDAVLGRVTAARVEGGKLIGTLAFADTEAGRAAEGMVSRGELRGISIGYQVNEWTITEGEPGAPESRTATRWELLEASLVPVPADADAGIRSLPGEGPASIPERNSSMSKFTARDGVAMIDSARGFGPDVERLARELVDAIDDGTTTPDAARAAILRAAGAAQGARTAGIRAGGGIDVGARTMDNPAFRGAAMADAIFARMSGKEPSEEGREFMRLSVPQIAAEILEQRGHRGVHRMSAHEAIGMAWRSAGDAQGMTTTFDLPNLLQGAGNRFLLDRYAMFESPIKQLARKRSASDFKEITGLEISGTGLLDRVNESGEIKFGTLSERKEKYRLATYAKRYALSRQAIVNDDLSVFADLLNALARSAARTEAVLLADLINSNPVLDDGNPVFDASHGNVAASGADPGVDTLDAARQAMRGQKDLDGTPLIVSPKYVLAPVSLETKLEVLLTSTIAPATTDNVNPFAGKMTPLVDPLLTGGAWYIFSDPTVAPAIEYALLDGQEAPHIEMNEVWEALGTGFRAYHDFGCAFIDAKGAYRNPGA